jgi:FMN phosphatase YigB (HAD superfamily)
MTMMAHSDRGVRNVVFDLGGVLIDWNPRKIAESAFPDKAEQDAVLSIIFRHEHWVKYDRGDIAAETAVAYFSQVSGIAPPGIARFLAVYQQSLTAIPAHVRWFNELHGQGVALYCLSNCSAQVFATLSERYPFFAGFRGVVISGVSHVAKPEREAFLYLLDQYGLEAGQTVLVDDRADNVEAARGIGMKTVLFTTLAESRHQLAAILAMRASGPKGCRGLP